MVLCQEGTAFSVSGGFPGMGENRGASLRFDHHQKLIGNRIAQAQVRQVRRAPGNV